MYRDVKRKCPGCGEPMAELPVEVEESRVLVDLCRGCGGVYLDFLDGTPGVVARALVEGPVAELREGDRIGAAATCPDCGGAMAAHVELDEVFRCESCWSVFCGPAGLESLAAHAAALTRPREPSFFQGLLETISRAMKG